MKNRKNNDFYYIYGSLKFKNFSHFYVANFNNKKAKKMRILVIFIQKNSLLLIQKQVLKTNFYKKHCFILFFKQNI